MITWENGAILVGASALAGAINSVAGGGTLLTFPALTFGAGVSAIVANATSTVALWPGQLSSLWGYRSEIQQNVRSIVPLTVIGIAGGVVGALLLLHTSSAFFDHLVPFLVLGATAIFSAQEPLARWQRKRVAAAAKPADGGGAGDGGDAAKDGNAGEALRLTLPVALFLFAVAVYGGYFGAGIGILTLAAFGLLGMTNIHQMNGIKAIFTLWINGVAAILFMAERLVDWRVAAIMAVGAIVGGYAGAGVARRIGQKNVRRVVIGIGLGLTASLLYKLLR